MWGRMLGRMWGQFHSSRRFISYLMTVRKPFSLVSFKILSYRMPLKLPDIVKHPILCRYCSTEIPIFQAALKAKPDFDTIRP